MLSEKLRRSSGVRILFVGAVALVVAMALSIASTNQAEAKKNTKPFTKTSTVVQNNTFANSTATPVRLTGASPYTFKKTSKVKKIKKVTVTLTAAVQNPADDLWLGLDGIDTGIRITGLNNTSFSTVTLRGAPENAKRIKAALKDGTLAGTVIDRTSATPTTFYLPPTSFDTTLRIKGKQIKRR